MSIRNVLDHALSDILRVISPTSEDWEIRGQIIGDICRAVETVESLRGATVEPFGSLVANLYSRWSDLDISIELLNGSHISNSGKKRKQTLLEDLLRALKVTGGWRSVQLISHARVPILKLKSNIQSISCDISIDNLQGQMKSKLLFWISRIDSRFRDMVLLVKEWAKAHGINNSRTGTFNSYTLSLLVIFHFQTCVPAILPPLKEIYPSNMVDDLTGVRVDAEKYIAETCEANIARILSNRSRQINQRSLSALFLSFLEKFCDIDLRATELGICPYTGQWDRIDSNMRWLPKTYALFVEDPFDQPQNPARSVGEGQLTKIAEAFKLTYHRLRSGNLDQNSLLAELALPRVLRSIMGPPSWNPHYNGRHHHATTPQAWGAPPRSAPQKQAQSRMFNHQNARPGTHPNNSGNRGPVQGQQVWRQKVKEQTSSCQSKKSEV